MMHTENDNEPSARVTLTTINAQLQELVTQVAVLTEKLPPQSTQLDDHEKRLRSIETRMWLAVGAFGLIAAASPYLQKLIFH